MKTVQYVVLLCVFFSHRAVLAENTNTSSGAQNSQSHNEIIIRQPVMVNRALQSFIGKIGNRILSQSPDLDGLDFLLLDSGQVNSFHSSSGYIYLTRGLLFLANDESHIASIVALEVANLERVWVSEIELYKRVADLLSASAYNPAALPDFLSILIRHKRYVENNQSAQTVIGSSYERLINEPDDSVLNSLQNYVSELNSRAGVEFARRPKSEFLQLLDGLAVGQSPSIVLKGLGPQTVKEEGFTVFLPDNWTFFRRDQVAEVIPFKANALEIELNDSALVLRSPLKQATEIIIFDFEQANPDQSAQQNLQAHLKNISVKSKVSRHGPINGNSLQGYLIEGRVSIEIKGGQEARGISLGSGITSSFNHISAVVYLADKIIVLTMFPITFGNEYSELDIDAFRNIVSRIRDQQEGRPETGHRRIKVHKVSQGQNITSLASDSTLTDGASVMRVLNDLRLDEQIEAGQLIKLISYRD